MSNDEGPVGLVAWILYYRNDLPGFFEQQILQNYHQAGFLDASVQTQVDYATDQYRIEIDDGPRFELQGPFSK